MKSKSIFISRYVFSNSPLLLDADYTLFAKSLIKFENITVSSFPKSDWYFFYSRNGVYFGLRQILDRSVLDATKIATMGKGTAKQFENMTGRMPDFIGSGDADNVSSEFIKVAKGADVVFVRAVHSLKSIQENLKGKLNGSDLITYKNFIDDTATIPVTDIAVFTSPMNVDAYFLNKTADASPVLIALGKSTKKAISKYSESEILMPVEPTESALRVLIDRVLAP